MYFLFEIKEAKNYWILHAAFLWRNCLHNRLGWLKHPRRKADISPRYHWFPREMTVSWGSERLQKFHTVDVSLPSLGSASDWSWCKGKFASNNQRHYPYLGGSGSSVVSRTSFRVETSSGVAKCRLFSLDLQIMAGVTLLKQDQRISRTDYFKFYLAAQRGSK